MTTSTAELQRQVTELEQLLAQERSRNEQLEWALSRSREGLERSEDLLRNITATVPVVVHQVRFDEHEQPYFSYISDRVSTIYEVDAQTVLNDPTQIFRLVHPEDAESIARTTAIAFRTRSKWALEFRVIPASGRLRWVSGAAEPFQLPDGSFAWNGVTYDITEYKLAARQSQDNEERYRALFTNDIDAISIFDIETKRIVDVNDAYLKLYGYEREEVIGQPVSIVSAEPEATHRAVDQAAVGGEVLIQERRHRRKDGTLLMVEIAAGPFSWREQKLMYAFIRNITPRKKAEEALIAHEKGLQQKNAELRRALDEVTQLRGFLPICCHCKKIRDVNGYWEQLEVYISRHSAADFTHTYCPNCIHEFFPGLSADELERPVLAHGTGTNEPGEER